MSARRGRVGTASGPQPDRWGTPPEASGAHWHPFIPGRPGDDHGPGDWMPPLTLWVGVDGTHWWAADPHAGAPWTAIPGVAPTAASADPAGARVAFFADREAAIRYLLPHLSGIVGIGLDALRARLRAG